ncbi:MAG: polysaccharide deacetylase family protein [Polyangiales bacterium]
MRRLLRIRSIPIVLLAGFAACSSEHPDTGPRGGDSLGVHSDPLTLDPSIPFLDFDQNADDPTAIALTFDDGPDETNTAKVLDALKSANVKATFFINTNNYVDVNSSSLARSLISRMHNEGHHIGNHTVHHYDLGSSSTNVRSEIDGVYQIMKSLVPGALQRRLFRAPYGNPYFGPQSRLDYVAPIVAEYGVHVGWNIDPTDYNCGTTSCVLDNVLNEVDAGKNGLILMHCTQGPTAAALPTLISSLRSRGKHFVFVEDLVLDKYGKPSRDLITCDADSDCVSGETCKSDHHCSPSSGGTDAGTDTGTADTGTADTGTADTGRADSTVDSTTDTSVTDTRVSDSGSDTSVTDSGSDTGDTGTDSGGTPQVVYCASLNVTTGTVQRASTACGEAGGLATQDGVTARWTPVSGTAKTTAYAQYNLTGTPKSLEVDVSFLGDDKTEPLWYWSILNPSTGGWVQFGDNSWAGNWVTTAHAFTISNPAQYVDASGHVKVRFKTNTSTNDAELDRMLLKVTY